MRYPVLGIFMLGGAAAAQTPPATPNAMAPGAAFAAFAGQWRGTATITGRDGKQQQVIQTERVGPLLGGDVMVVEGHAYERDGRDAGFNALSIVSRAGDGYEWRSYAGGHVGTFPIALAPGRFEWVMPAGPQGNVRYTATVAAGKWHEEGWFERAGTRVAKVFDMTLNRVSDTSWPAGAPVSPK